MFAGFFMDFLGPVGATQTFQVQFGHLGATAALTFALTSRRTTTRRAAPRLREPELREEFEELEAEPKQIKLITHHSINDICNIYLLYHYIYLHYYSYVICVFVGYFVGYLGLYMIDS